jgi:hypothetical protein
MKQNKVMKSNLLQNINKNHAQINLVLELKAKWFIYILYSPMMIEIQL